MAEIKVSEVDKWLDMAIAQEKFKRACRIETDEHIKGFQTHTLYIEITDKGLGDLMTDLDLPEKIA